MTLYSHAQKRSLVNLKYTVADSLFDGRNLFLEIHGKSMQQPVYTSLHSKLDTTRHSHTGLQCNYLD
jgi:hypothetical protein